MEKRKAALVEAGISEEDVEESLASFDALADEAFESVVALMKKKAIKKDEKDEEAMMKKPKAEESEAEVEEAEEEAEAEITPEAFEEVETSEAALVEADEHDPIEATRASVADWLETHVLSNK